jgi:hypothetical protein
MRGVRLTCARWHLGLWVSAARLPASIRQVQYDRGIGSFQISPIPT